MLFATKALEKYTIEAILEKGGQGVVYQARTGMFLYFIFNKIVTQKIPEGNEKLCVKFFIFNPHHSSKDPEKQMEKFLGRFDREVDNLMALNIKNYSFVPKLENFFVILQKEEGIFVILKSDYSLTHFNYSSKRTIKQKDSTNPCFN